MERPGLQSDGDLEDARLARALRTALSTVRAAMTLTAPTAHTDLLDSIVQTAAEVLDTSDATLYEVDESAQELIFAVTLGSSASELHGTRMPISTGIAGWVAVTGEAMAASDVAQNPHWASDIGHRIGRTPRTILAVPLLLQGRVTGVLEVMDRRDGQPFSAADMSTLGMFAQQAAIAIAQSHALRNLTSLVQMTLAELGVSDELSARIPQVVDRLEQDSAYTDLVELATLIANLGPAGVQLSRQVLSAVATFAHTYTAHD